MTTNRVFVLDQHGQALMPCTPRKARLLLQSNRAKAVKKTPFTIQLEQPASSYKQGVQIGIDTGQRFIGMAVVSQNRVLYQATIKLRQDVKDLIDLRRIYRRSRRNRKTRYRQARFNNRIKGRNKIGKWFPPSVQAKIDHNIHWIERLIAVSPEANLTIEIGKFDPHKLKNPEVSGIGYQQGDLYGWENARMYVFSRDNYTCQVCKRHHDKETKKPLKLHAHHIRFRSLGGSDRVENLLTVCTDCHTHQNHQPGSILHELMQKGKTKRLDLSAATQMNAIKSSIIRKFGQLPNVQFTFGYITNLQRKALKLPKSHFNDAIAMTGLENITSQPEDVILIYQARRKKRSLHEAIARKGRKQPNHNQKRNAKNTPFVIRKQGDKVYLGDKVSRGNQSGYVAGFSKKSAYVRGDDGKLISFVNSKGVSRNMVNLSELTVHHHTSGWQLFSIPSVIIC